MSRFLAGFTGGLLGKGGVGATPWLPTDEATISNWYSGSDDSKITIAGGAVASWSSITASGDILTQGTEAFKPVHNSTLDFVDFGNAANKIIQDTAVAVATGLVTNGDHCLYTVFELYKVGTYFVVNLDTGGANNGTAIQYWSPTDSFRLYCNNTVNTGFVEVSAASFSAGAKMCVGAIISGVGLSASINGTVTSGGTALPFTSTRFRIGRTQANLGKVYDTVTFSTASSTIYQKVEGYLCHKHGITLPSGHPYEFAAP